LYSTPYVPHKPTKLIFVKTGTNITQQTISHFTHFSNVISLTSLTSVVPILIKDGRTYQLLSKVMAMSLTVPLKRYIFLKLWGKSTCPTSG